MTDRPSDLTSSPKYQPRRGILSFRKFALMASVVAGLGVAGYGLAPNHRIDVFSTPAQAQVNTEVSKVQTPVGFADIVERVKPSVISVKVRIKEKTWATTCRSRPARRWNASSAASAVRTACRRACIAAAGIS